VPDVVGQVLLLLLEDPEVGEDVGRSQFGDQFLFRVLRTELRVRLGRVEPGETFRVTRAVDRFVKAGLEPSGRAGRSTKVGQVDQIIAGFSSSLISYRP